MPLSIYSEAVQPSGSFAGAGAIKVLGRPKLSTLGLVLRESIQNSWDARKEDRQVRFTITRRELSEPEINILSDQVFPGSKEVGVRVGDALRSRPQILVLTDMGTVGLEGPARANEVEDDEPQRFVNFFRNIGSHQDVAGTGGTYGFGKSSLYRLSKSKAIVVFTRARPAPGANLESRFMAAGIGKSCRRGSQLLTGRHWWGAAGTRRDPIVDPVIGDAAVRLARRLKLNFSHNEAGTSIAILSPEIDNEDEFRTEVLETLAYNFWPKMIGIADAEPNIQFSFSDKGEEIEIPDPRNHPKISPFVSAYSSLFRPNRVVKAETVTISARGANVSTGRIAWIRTPFTQNAGVQRKKRWEPFGDVTHHVCLLRTPELVVKYEKTQPPIGGAQLGYAAVFRAADEHNDAFANAEPPAHDDWEPASLPKKEKDIVNKTMKALRELMRGVADAGGSVSASRSSQVPLGHLASFLGELLDGVESDGPHVVVGGTSGPVSGTRRRVGSAGRIEVISTQIFESVAHPGAVVAEIGVELRGAQPGASVRIIAQGGVQTPDGIETEAPEEAPTVNVLSWRDERGATLALGSELIIRAQVKWRALTVVAVVPERLLGAISFSCIMEQPD